TMTREDILKLRQTAFRRFYSRPSFILKKFFELRNMNDFLAAMRSIRSLFYLWTKIGLFSRVKDKRGQPK
ncbi:MAG: hypothetical protein Q8M34_09835, partial [Thermodesulfovibrionales bacterium]|nr:hypothetical protein [Thermodesulfovibrionales bacterium]